MKNLSLFMIGSMLTSLVLANPCESSLKGTLDCELISDLQNSTAEVCFQKDTDTKNFKAHSAKLLTGQEILIGDYNGSMFDIVLASEGRIYGGGASMEIMRSTDLKSSSARVILDKTSMKEFKIKIITQTDKQVLKCFIK